jgi:hypothetical protein
VARRRLLPRLAAKPGRGLHKRIANFTLKSGAGHQQPRPMHTQFEKTGRSEGKISWRVTPDIIHKRLILVRIREENINRLSHDYTLHKATLACLQA